MKKLSVIIIAFLILFSLAGCAPDPNSVFLKFTEAAHGEKADTAINCCSKELQEKYSSATEKEKEALSTMLKFAAPVAPKLIKKEIKGDSAKLCYEGKIYTKKAERETGRMWVEFVKEGNEWKIKKMGVDKNE